MKAAADGAIAALLAPAAAGRRVRASRPRAASRWWPGPTAAPTDRVALRYAVADAERFAKVVTTHGRGRVRGLRRAPRAHPPRVPGCAGRRARPAPTPRAPPEGEWTSSSTTPATPTTAG